MVAKATLAGLSVAITRSADQAQGMADEVESLGGKALLLPLIQVKAHENKELIHEIFAEIAWYDWVVFTSANGVKYFFEHFYKCFEDIRSIGGMQIACIGEKTAEEVRKRRLKVDLVPEESTSEGMLKAMMEDHTLDSQKILVTQGNRNREVLVKGLEEEGRAIVDRFQVYETELNDLTGNEAAERFRQEGADAIVFTSTSCVESFAGQAGNLQITAGGKRPKVVSIGPVTSQALKDKGLPVDYEAKEPSVDGILKALGKMA